MSHVHAQKTSDDSCANFTNICWKFLEMRARKAHFEAKRGEILAQSRFSLEKFQKVDLSRHFAEMAQNIALFWSLRRVKV